MQAAFALAAFNLVCQVHRAGDHTQPPISAAITYRVDPMLGRWCRDPCVTTQPIAALSELEVVFVTESGDFAAPFREVVQIRRATGAYTETEFYPSDAPGRTRPTRLGECALARFSGFPPSGLVTAFPLIARVPTRLEEIRPAATPR